MAADGAIEAVASAKRDALDAGTAGEALDSVMVRLHAPFSLWLGALVAFTHPEEVVIVASWTPGGSPFQPGVRLRPGGTPELERMAGAILRGRTLAFDPSEADLGMIGDLLDAGTPTEVVAVPIRQDRRTAGFFGVVSTADEGLDDESVRLLEALVVGVRPRFAGWCREAVEVVA